MKDFRREPLAAHAEKIGYWLDDSSAHGGADPRRLVSDDAFTDDERRRVVAYLSRGRVWRESFGSSWCRFGCSGGMKSDHRMGRCDLTDCSFVWPEGLAHYVRDHGIALPDYFLNHLRDRRFQPSTLTEWDGSAFQRRQAELVTLHDEQWEAWCRARGAWIDGLSWR